LSRQSFKAISIVDETVLPQIKQKEDKKAQKAQLKAERAAAKEEYKARQAAKKAAEKNNK
jgi:hypothetical protein